eukprot:TRINITY_DN3395_c0_g1_i1.p1 TRINITY_DN3395_c0_g1~~TRINITY_DN3395_c0_g1_i1.p1  ORF type:complete len:105 (-),score=25.98 TRINITY_DN3395_c0_g1_i1:426-716(-)
MIRRPPRSTRKESSAASDVYKRQILRKVKNKVHISDYSYQDELELIEMHYLTIVMMNYIRSPIPKEDYKRKRRTDFMHTVVSSISSKMLVVSVLYI